MRIPRKGVLNMEEIYIRHRQPKFWLVIVIISFLFLEISIKTASFLDAEDYYTPNYYRTVPSLAISQENTLISVSDPSNPCLDRIIKKMPVIVTAYSSNPWETDDDPYITAAGTFVKEGIVANNYLPFGSKIKMPDLYGDRIFVVEDRMSWKKGNYHIDIWFPSYEEALNFGVKRTYVEILEM